MKPDESKTNPSEPFIPILTVMLDYGNAPFLWLVDDPDQGGVGGMLCDGTCWGRWCPMSEGLWRKFADWAIAFNRTAFYSDSFDADAWDWPACHAGGLLLSRWLKEEVGDAFRVIYDKPCEDPNHRMDERTEVLTDGALRPLMVASGRFPEPIRFCGHIVSGGQTGADRAALDFAIRHGYTHGGWAPRGRKAEDGIIPPTYQLVELAEGGYRQRTRCNVQDSDATLIVNLGPLDGGSLATQGFANKAGKPCLVVQVDAGLTTDAIDRVAGWLKQHDVHTLNVAGPRESKRPGIQRLTGELLEAVDIAFEAD